jgi:hypothetical protein
MPESHRFRTIEDAQAFMDSTWPFWEKVALYAVPPFIIENGINKPNPEYTNAPYELGYILAKDWRDRIIPEEQK